MPDNHERAWEHPWLRVNCLIGRDHGDGGPDVWADVKKALGWALAERGRLRRSAWWN